MATTSRRWRHAIERVAVESAAAGLPSLTHGSIRLLARAVGGVVSRCDRRGRRTARENLRLALGDAALAGEPGGVDGVVTRCYQGFARTFLEMFWLSADGPRKLPTLVEAVDDLAGAEAHANPHGCLYVTAHLGNFELAASITAACHGVDAVVAQEFANPALTPVFSRCRGWGGPKVIPQRQAALKLLRLLRRGGHSGLLTDLNVKPDGAATVIREFGRLTSVTPIHAELAKRTGASLIPSYAVPVGPDPAAPSRHGYRMVFAPPVATEGRSVRAIAQDCWDAFEPAIRAHPEGWLWMYKHWRYLPSGEDPGFYPDYANRSKKFDRLVERVEAADAAGAAMRTAAATPISSPPPAGGRV